MNLKDLLLPFGLALVTTWAVQYFFLKSPTDQSDTVARSGQQFTAPKTKQEQKPLNTEIDFVDVDRSKKAQITEIETDGARLRFSTDGASLERLIFKSGYASLSHDLSTIEPVTETERENRCFLVALNEKTPFFYMLVHNKELENAFEIAYQTQTSDAVIRKTYTVYKKTSKIDLQLSVEPKHDKEIEARIFYPSPVIAELEGDDIVNAISTSEKGSLIKTSRQSLDPGIGWFAPTIFGVEDKFFVHAMVDDINGFAKRSYYRFSDKTLFSILEGQAVKEKTTWRISFYFGPKEHQALAAVDPRLEQTLDYSGLLAPISKFLLMIIKKLDNFLGNYGYAIIVLTILMRLLMAPFTYKSQESIKKQKEFDKKLRYVQQRYKDDPETLARERTELIRKHGMPGVTGCLPLLLQLPVFIALSRLLSNSIELYRAPFLIWADLSAKDPYYIFPILIAGTMFAQALTADAKGRMPLMAMGLVFGAFSASFSVGLCLYIFMSTLLGVAQTALFKKVKA